MMAARVTDIVARLQGPRAMATRGGHKVDDGMHALCRDQRPRVPGMARLTARLAATLRAATPYAGPAGEPVR